MYAMHDVALDAVAERSARQIMESFAARTGLAPAGPQRRYLWTDAFALANYLTLYRRTGDDAFRELAVSLIDRVHHVLGRHRDDDPRRGWISGLEDEDAERHPTVGGLRIGKARNERGASEPMDPDAEWEMDGQYYHYLVRWMHALDRAAEVLGAPTLHAWAVELAVAAHRGFTYAPSRSGPKRMHWKMSIDLTRPLVPSEGAHDPLDGLVTLCELQAHTPVAFPGRDLSLEIGDLAEMSRGRDWATADPLGVGGLLADASWSAQLLDENAPGRAFLAPVLPGVVRATVTSLHAVLEGHLFRLPPSRRLAFRELGLAIGLRAAGALVASPAADVVGEDAISALERYLPLADTITETWLGAASRATALWKEHRDINEVMLATALIPDEHVRA